MTHTLRPLAVVVVAVLALAAPSAGAAQDKPLRDDVVMQMIPVLRLQAAQADQARAEVAALTKTGTDYFTLLDDIGTGKADPFTWLKGQSPNAVVPTSAKYEAQMSRWVSGKRMLEPVAVFSFGLQAADELSTNALAQGGAEAWLKSGTDKMTSAAGRKVQALSDSIGAFYAAKHFTGPRQEMLYESTYSSADNAVDALFFMANPFAGGTGAPNIGGGPMLEIKLNPAKNPMGRNVTPAQLATAMERIGLTEEEYDAHVTALVAARKDASDPSGMTVNPALPPELAKEMSGMYAARKRNAVTYLRYAAQLNPLLEKLGF